MADQGTFDRDLSRSVDDSSLGALLAELAGARARWGAHARPFRRPGRRMKVAANLPRLRAELDRCYAELAAY